MHLHLKKIAFNTMALTKLSGYDDQASTSHNRVAQPPSAVFEFLLSDRQQQHGECA
jgi:hypothetical protein